MTPITQKTSKTANSKSVRIEGDIMKAAEDTAAVMTRTVASQIRHWLKLGMALDNSPKFSHEKIAEALRGRISPDTLTETEQLIYSSQLQEVMSAPSGQEKAFFDQRASNGQGVGLADDASAT